MQLPRRHPQDAERSAHGSMVDAVVCVLSKDPLVLYTITKKENTCLGHCRDIPVCHQPWTVKQTKHGHPVFCGLRLVTSLMRMPCSCGQLAASRSSVLSAQPHGRSSTPHYSPCSKLLKIGHRIRILDTPFSDITLTEGWSLFSHLG